MDAIYHITTRSAWLKAKAAGFYSPPSLEAEGFIHCSRSEQVLAVANALFRAREDIVLLKIALDRLNASVQEECTESGALYPHIYGPLNCDAVVDVSDLLPDAKGTFSWPLDDIRPPTDAGVGAVAAGSEAVFANLLV
jgi:uncharacterized protein (DUF952 family)